MAINAQYADYGLQIAQGIAGFMIGSINAKLQAQLQQYRNEIMKVQESMNANRITINEINTRDAATRLDFAIQAQAHHDQGAASVAAATAGVRGGSVDSTMRGLRRSAAFAQQKRVEVVSQEMRSHLEERRSNALATAMSMDITVHQKPSILSAAVGVGMNLLDSYKDNQTPSQKAGPSSVTSPSSSLGLGTPALRQNSNLLDNDYWRLLPNVGG